MAARSWDAGGGSDESKVAEWLRAQESKDLVRFVTIGSVDDGKSTLIGRLLFDAHGVYRDQLDAVRKASARGATRGAESASEIDFSLLTDGLAAEREQGITIDVAYRYFATDRRKFIIADTPGHVQYTRNMATGASTADIAVILVDARLGVLAQTRRHAQIAALLGIPHVIACVNKMDLVGFERARFDAIASELAEIGTRLGLAALSAIPVSALAGDNVVVPSERTPWWSGGTLLGRLESLPVATEARRAGDPEAAVSFRLPVQIVLRPSIAYRGFAGRIASGTIRTGDEIVALPSGKRTRVIGVDLDGRDVGVASAPESIALRLADEIDVSRGDVLASPTDPPRVVHEVLADVVWMSERPLDRGKTYLVKHTTRTVRADLDVVHGTDPETLSPEPRDTLALNDIGRVELRLRSPLFVDPYAVDRTMGAFIVIDSVTNDTVAAGMIVDESEPRSRSPRADSSSLRSQVSPRERSERLGQKGGVVRVLAPTLAEARALAVLLERDLFDRGRVAIVVESEEAAAACARASLFALLVSDETPLGYAVDALGEQLHEADADDLESLAIRAAERLAEHALVTVDRASPRSR